jgi:hypothetical protein
MDPRFPLPAPSSGGGSRGHHRRAHSETFLRFPDADLLLDPDGDFSFSDLDFPSLSDDSPAISDPTPPPPPQQQQQAASPQAASRPPRDAHTRSLSLDAAFFEGLALQGGAGGTSSGSGGGHKRSGSMDGVSSPFEGESALSGGLLDYAKKAMPADRVAELALIDPKRAKRWGKCFVAVLLPFNLTIDAKCFQDPEGDLSPYIQSCPFFKYGTSRHSLHPQMRCNCARETCMNRAYCNCCLLLVY